MVRSRERIREFPILINEFIVERKKDLSEE
jgi:hypothetical protein